LSRPEIYLDEIGIRNPKRINSIHASVLPQEILEIPHMLRAREMIDGIATAITKFY